MAFFSIVSVGNRVWAAKAGAIEGCGKGERGPAVRESY
jgi:hypothetical protein